MRWDKTWLRFPIYSITFVFAFYFFDLAAIAPIAGLATAPEQLTEVSKILNLLITVEGILLGLSPILFDKFGRGFWGAVSVTITAFALLWSLLTVILADTMARFDTVFEDYVISLGFFGTVLVFYVISAWEVWVEKRKGRRS